VPAASAPEFCEECENEARQVLVPIDLHQSGPHHAVGEKCRMIASAQISVYPLRQARLGPAVETVRAALEARGLAPQTGPMSTLVIGDSALLFAALGESFEATASLGEVVMTVAFSNACPVEKLAGNP
jgi:uncharacterized protein YqgV (UPF0045/DUF77 family)